MVKNDDFEGLWNSLCINCVPGKYESFLKVLTEHAKSDDFGPKKGLKRV
jgi:hypothetical protein